MGGMRLAIFTFCLCFAMLAIGIPPKVVKVRIETECGNIDLELYADKAPKTVENFLMYVKAGTYKDAVFHRTVTPFNQPKNKVKIEVVQGGRDPKSSAKDLPPILLERTNKTGIKHVDGAVSMARDAADSATSDFFICIGDQPELDFGGKRNPDGQGFAAFGKVTKGMDVVLMIQKSPEKDQSLAPPIKILNIRVLT